MEHKDRIEVPVVWIEQGGPILNKQPMDFSRQLGFAVDTIVTLADGSKHTKRSKSGKKKDLIAEVAKYPCRPKYPEFACFNEEGKLYMWSTRFVLFRRADEEVDEDTAKWLKACDDYEQRRAREICEEVYGA